jgi:aspartyl protease/uncharacterized protein DUF4124
MLSFSQMFTGFIAVAILFSLCSSGSSADYYKWTDENGNLHFSDSFQKIPEKYRDQIEKRGFIDNAPSQSEPLVKTHQSKLPLRYEESKEKPLKRFEVPYEPYEGSAKRVIIDAVFNNSVTAPMAIDTGAPDTVISVKLAEKIGLFDEDQGRLVIKTGGIGGTAPAIRSIIDNIHVGGAKSEFIPATVIDSISESFDGLLGLDFVSNYSVTIDSKRKMVIFEELPSDPDLPGGHDKEWWTSHFKEFSESRAKWKAYSEDLEKKIHDSMRSIGNEDVRRKAFADSQYKEADKLFDKLNRYAREHSVPTEWRQY